MAFGTETQLPFINQSISRQLRSGAFRSKSQVGPQTAQAVTRGALEADRQSALSQAAQSSQLKQQREIANQNADLARSGQAQSQVQFESHQQAQADLQAQQLAHEKSQQEAALAAQNAAAAQDQANFDQEQHEARKRRKAQERSFWEGAFSS